MKSHTTEKIIEEAVYLAKTWQERANELLSQKEKRFQKKYVRLLNHPLDKVILIQMIDQGFRSKDAKRVSNQINSILKSYGIPRFFSPFERFLTRLFLIFGRYIPTISVPILIYRIRKESSRFILPAEERSLFPLLQQRKDRSIRMIINHLGEAVLGEEQAVSHLNIYLGYLKRPEVEYISVKISSLHSQNLPIAHEHTVFVLKERLSILYRTAKENFFIQKDGGKKAKFVNLDMEGYSDVSPTISAFTRTLEQEEFSGYSAGIALQSYLPDSYEIQKELTKWAKKREANGGSPIRIRIVKGANLELEKVESGISNWPLAPYDNKLEVDANFKRMVEFGMRPENIEAVHLGIGSHNLFDLAYAYQFARHRGVDGNVSFEMLDGMADHVQRAILETTKDMLVYSPVVLKENFINAIAYLMRRLDENTARENFLRYASHLSTDSSEWTYLKEQFLASCRYINKAGKIPNRVQNRTEQCQGRKINTFFEEEFKNEPDTDWTRPANRKWAQSIIDKWKKGLDERPVEIPLVVGQREIYKNRQVMKCSDPSQINADNEDRVYVATCALAEIEDIEDSFKIAKADPGQWRDTSLAKRYEVLSRVAVNLRRARGDLIGSAACHTGKVFTEADIEVSEAIDFVEYYPLSLKVFEELSHVKYSPKGVGLVISPWNFPIAIPCGGITAALAAGNTVVFKPASSAVFPAWELCKCFWEAGVSKNVLQFLPCMGESIGAALTRHPEVDFIIFTGGTDTGLKILQQRPEVYFAGETGGKNATIVTAMSDRDQAIKDIIHSAFSNCGQKCSATSLVILEKEVYEDPDFKKQMVDAAKSCNVGSAWELENRIGPLIHPPKGKLIRGLTELEPGEEWALKPKNINGNPNLWTPGIKWGVVPGSYTHMTEFFGPLLGAICAEDLDHAIKIANQTGYGLTSGLESLDIREQEYWKKRIRSGNLYINRGTTGAVVLRQPFGGMGKSALGAGIKAGGPNYAIQFMDAEHIAFPCFSNTKKAYPLMELSLEWKKRLDKGELHEYEQDLKKIIHAVTSYLNAFDQEFSREKDYFHLQGQDNLVRYLPIGAVVVRLHVNDSLFEIFARIAAVRVSGCTLTISIPSDLTEDHPWFLFKKEAQRFIGNAEIIYQSDKELIDIIPQIQGIRYSNPDRVPKEIFEAAAKRGFYISRTKVAMEGRIELLQYYQEQSICNNYHRYGNLGERALNTQ
ncbi:MAG: bifunctional proline dehydrogenase/L-glutamate gamma-semialdehyde dehydrogenase [Thermodesulfobacteriota bacterium]|nr:bifunctional proline dehydrogenase/L-glutamate gamma-semialdehyde dehydrogenase [Thermodesulfobacteriota bacterium]